MNKLKALWSNATVRDTALAALAALVGAVAIYFKSPAAVVLYIALRAAVSAWIEKNN